MGLNDWPTVGEVAAWTEGTCAKQGLAVKIGEPRVIAAAVTLLRGEPPSQTRQIGSTRSGSKRARPGTARPITARSRTAETIAR